MSTDTTIAYDSKVTVLTSDVLSAIQAHGAEAFPHECCGALIAIGGTVIEAYKIENTTTEGAARRFKVSPDDYRRAESRARALRGALVGFYHSHPNAPARPSAYDLEHAWPNFTYVIISVRAGEPGDITAWHLRDDRSGFDEGELKWPIGS